MLAAGALRIAVLAPPWIPVPPSGYGGIETVVAVLVDSLAARGHDVTLFAAPGSAWSGRTEIVLDRPAAEMGAARHEADHVAAAFDAIESADDPYDVVHDHCGHVALAMADRLRVPVVHTEHGPFTSTDRAFYRRHGHRALIVALTRAHALGAPPGTRLHGAIPNPLDLERWHPGGPAGDHVLWLGRFAEEKGAHRAIEAARRAGVPLILAGVVQPGQERYFETAIAPHIDGRAVVFAGEVGGERKRRLLAGARALLMPIRWEEPFGMVMVEAMSCGTPVVAFPEGAAPEIVGDGVSGLLVDDERGMADAIRAVARLRPADCRARALELCDPQRVARAYERAYRAAMAAAALPATMDGLLAAASRSTAAA